MRVYISDGDEEMILRKGLAAVTIVVMMMSIPAHASDLCREDIAASVAIVKGMADYKAALDAGYGACAVSYPEKFEPFEKTVRVMKTNMQKELDQALSVLDLRISGAKSCAGEREKTTALQNEMHKMISSQYKKSYNRRHKIMSKEGLVSAAQDSCLLMQGMLEKYDRHYDDYKKLHFILYESSKKQGKMTGLIKRADYKEFEKSRDSLTIEAPSFRADAKNSTPEK